MRKILVLGCISAMSVHAGVYPGASKRLNRFFKNPQKVMNERVKKVHHTLSGKAPKRFSKKAINNGTYIHEKAFVREVIAGERNPNPMIPKEYSPVDWYKDNPYNLIDLLPNGERRTRNIKIMDQNWKTGALSVQPWSDDYWAIAKGILGKRYEDYDFPTYTWEESHNYVLEKDALTIFESGNQAAIDTLSPSEKYDLALGNKNLSFTKENWRQGQHYWDEYGNVESWMGICHGWAAAAYMLERPLYPVTIVSKLDNKTKITFYPADIKALASYLWANYAPRSRFIGGRCDVKDPEQDENGRIIDQDCFDTNPGTWHISVVNQIARANRSMVMDATYDYEVWNQPIVEYEYDYFNINTRMDTENLEDALVAIEDVQDDVFKNYRNNPKAKYILGVNMAVTYSVEHDPMHTDQDSEDYDELSTAYYQYDLELDERMKILGGEWYTNDHPDFLWTPAPGDKAGKYGDGRSLSANVDTLIKLSQTPPTDEGENE